MGKYSGLGQKFLDFLFACCVALESLQQLDGSLRMKEFVLAKIDCRAAATAQQAQQTIVPNMQVTNAVNHRKELPRLSQSNLVGFSWILLEVGWSVNHMGSSRADCVTQPALLYLRLLVFPNDI